MHYQRLPVASPPRLISEVIYCHICRVISLDNKEELLLATSDHPPFSTSSTPPSPPKPPASLLTFPSASLSFSLSLHLLGVRYVCTQPVYIIIIQIEMIKQPMTDVFPLCPACLSSHSEMNPQRKGLVKSAAIIHGQNLPLLFSLNSQRFCY